MKRTTRRIPSALALVGALAIASCGPADTTKWQTVAPEGSAFTVSMPGAPRTDRHVATGAKPSFESTVYTLVLPDDGFFSVTEARYPDTLDTSDPDTRLEQGCDDVVESASAKQTSRQKIYLNGTQGRRVEADVPESVVPGGGSLYGRVYFANRRLYQLVAVLPHGASTAAADRFFDSFQIRTP